MAMTGLEQTTDFDVTNDVTDLRSVINHVKPLESQWHALGIQLKIKKDTLDRIEADHKQNGVQRCLSEMINYWQTNEDDPTWAKFADAVKNVGGHNDVVKSIRKLIHGSTSSPKEEESDSESGYSSHSGPDSDQDVLETSSLSPGCGCGECNVHKMCTKGCPEPDYTKRLPILTKYNGRATASESAAQASEVTPQGKQNSVEVFEKETLDLRKHYGSLVTDTSESLGKREKKDRVALYLLSSFPILKIVAEEMKKATNMYRLLTAVTCQACSWFNFDIIKGLIEKFGSAEDHTRLEEYEQHFQQFAKQRLPQGMTHIELGSKHGINGCKQLVIKVDREWESVTVGELERLCIEFAKTLGVERKSVYLTDVNEGCIMLTMMIPEEIAEDLSKRKLTIEQKTRLESERVVRLTCGKMKWFTTSVQSQQSFSDSEESEQEKTSRESSGTHHQLLTTVTTETNETNRTDSVSSCFSSTRSSVGKSCLSDIPPESKTQDAVSKQLKLHTHKKNKTRSMRQHHQGSKVKSQRKVRKKAAKFNYVAFTISTPTMVELRELITQLAKLAITERRYLINLPADTCHPTPAAGITSSKDSSSSGEFESGAGFAYDERRNWTHFPMLLRKHVPQPPHQPAAELNFLRMEYGSRQPNKSAPYTPVVSGGVAVMPTGIVGLPQSPKPVHFRPAAVQPQHVVRDNTDKLSRTIGTSISCKGPPPPLKPKPSCIQSTEPEMGIYSTPGSGDSGVYVTHSLPSLLDDPEDNDQGSQQYENITTTRGAHEEHVYEPIYDFDTGTGGSTQFNAGGCVHLKPMRARVSSMDESGHAGKLNAHYYKHLQRDDENAKDDPYTALNYGYQDSS